MEGPRKVRSDWAARIWIDGIGEAERRLEVTPAVAGWDRLSFRSYTFRRNQTIAGESATDEMAMVLLSGSVTLDVAGPGWQATWDCQGRPNVFAGAPYAIYLPPGHTYAMTVHGDADCAYGRAPAAGDRPPRLIRPEDVPTAEDHGGARTRSILTAAMTEHLRCAETVIGPGASSSITVPDPDPAASIELVSYYRTRLGTGSGTQWLSAADGAADHALLIEHGDAAIVRGTACRAESAPDTELYRLSFLASRNPKWVIR